MKNFGEGQGKPRYPHKETEVELDRTCIEERNEAIEREALGWSPQRRWRRG
jgi:hypothetical protein